MNEYDFRLHFLSQFYIHAHQFVDSNFDYNRFRDINPEDFFQNNFSALIQNFDFYMRNINYLCLVYNLLANKESKELFIKLLLYRTLGHFHVQIKNNKSWLQEEEILKLATPYLIGPSKINSKGLFGPLKHFERIPFGKRRISLDCWDINVSYALNREQYFLNKDDISVQPEIDDIVIDAGGCFGETSILFASTVGDKGHVYCFDPLHVHLDIIKYNIRQNHLEEIITPVLSGIGEVSNQIAEVEENYQINPGFSLNAAAENFPIISIDDYVKSNNINRIDFIKMDIEGAELQALKGGRNTIHNCNPKLAISLYHRLEDFIEIPLYIHSAHPEYKFYLDHHTIHAEETVLYCKT